MTFIESAVILLSFFGGFFGYISMEELLEIQGFFILKLRKKVSRFSVFLLEEFLLFMLKVVLGTLNYFHENPLIRENNALRLEKNSSTELFGESPNYFHPLPLNYTS